MWGAAGALLERQCALLFCNSDGQRSAAPFSDCRATLPSRWLGFFNFILTSYLLFITLRRVPYHRAWLNCAHSFLNSFLWWAAGLGFLSVFYPQASWGAARAWRGELGQHQLKVGGVEDCMRAVCHTLVTLSGP